MHGGLVRTLVEQRLNRLVERRGDHKVWGEVRPRPEHKPALREARVGKDEGVGPTGLRSHRKQIDVEGAGLPRLVGAARASLFPLDGLRQAEKGLRIAIGVRAKHCIQERRLLLLRRPGVGLGLVHRRDAHAPDGIVPLQVLGGRTEVAAAVPFVGAEAEVGSRHVRLASPKNHGSNFNPESPRRSVLMPTLPGCTDGFLKTSPRADMRRLLSLVCTLCLLLNDPDRAAPDSLLSPTLPRRVQLTDPLSDRRTPTHPSADPARQLDYLLPNTSLADRLVDGSARVARPLPPRLDGRHERPP